MFNDQIHRTRLALTLSAWFAGLAAAPVGHAFNFGDMMNPSRWMNGGDRHYDDRYYDDPFYGGPYGGYGYPGVYGVPHANPYAVPGFGAPPTGYPAPAYAPAPAAPPGTADNTSEVEALKRRIEELEAQQPPRQASPPPAAPDWPSAPAFRPMDQR